VSERLFLCDLNAEREGSWLLLLSSSKIFAFMKVALDFEIGIERSEKKVRNKKSSTS
jgi:hypothetical protein